MIHFQCPNCRRKLRAPDDYAGRSTRCPGCKQGLRIPPAQAAPDRDEAGIIKFRCSNCNQKIGLPLRYAGKHIRCKNCQAPIVVPRPADKAVQPPAAPESAGDSAPGLGLDDAPDWAAGLDAATSGRPGRLRLGPAGLPLAMGASLVAVTVGAAVWALIACVTGYEIGWVAWGIGVLAGLGLTLFTNERTARLGLLAALFALVGILLAKAFIARFYLIPRLEAVVRAPPLSDRDLDEALRDRQLMFAIICAELADKGHFDEDLSRRIIAIHNGLAPPEAASPATRAGRSKVLQAMNSWSEDRKRAAVRTQFQKIMAAIPSDSTALKVDFRVAFKATFSLFDVLWFAIALASAYGMAARKA